MGLNCQVNRTKTGEIESVNAFNKKPSALYRTILAEHPELTKEEGLRHYAKFYTDAFFNRHGNFTEGLSDLKIDNNGEPVYNQDALSTLRLSTKLESGFLKDFNITVTEFEAINDQVKKDGSISDFIAKVIQTSNTEDITKEAVFFAYMYLGKENGKLKSELKYSISTWDQYDSKFQTYVDQVKDAYGFIPDKSIWFNKVRDQIIIDFLAEELVKYANNPEAFDITGREKWTQKEARKFFNPTLIQQLIDYVKKFFAKMNKGQSTIKKQIRMSNAAKNIVHEMLNQEYRILDYKLDADQVKVYYEDTVKADPVGLEILDKARSLGLIVTGSLALRLQGDVFRSPDETLHDLDFSVPYSKLLEQKNLLDELLAYVGPDDNVLAMKGVEITERYEWFKEFKKSFPDFSFTNAFVNGEDVLTLQGVINGEFYTKAGKHERTFTNGETKIVKHKKGDHIQGTGYDIDLFLRITPEHKETHVDFFKHWRDIISAKIILARDKDLTDHKHFAPYRQDSDGVFTTPQHSYTRDLSITEKPLILTEETEPAKAPSKADPYAYDVDLGIYRNEKALAYITALSTALNVPFEFISALEAAQMTEDSLNPYTGQAGFFYKNKVYFVGTNIDPELALHEFAHPLVRYIKTVNRPLFDKLFEDVLATKEGKALVSESIQEYGEILNSIVEDLVKEEIIVKALTAQAIAIKNQTPVSKKFNNVIQKILYHIKQALRKLFKKVINIEKLDVDTTLQQLAESLANAENFNVDTTLLSKEDFVAYSNERKGFHDEMIKAYANKKEELGVFVDEHFEAVKQQYNLVIKNDNLKELKPILASEAGRGYLAESMRIGKYTTESELSDETKAAIEQLGEVEYLHKKVNAVVDNIITMDHMVTKVKDYLDSFKEDPDQQKALKEMHHYNKLISVWKLWMDHADSALSDVDVADNDALRNFLSGINNKIKKIDKTIRDTMVDSVSEVVLLANPLNDVLQANYDIEKDRLENLIKNSSGNSKKNYESRLKAEKEKFDRLYLDKDKIQLYLAGAVMDDNHMLNAWLVNYIGNPDPIVGGFAKYLKNHYTDVQVAAHIKYNEFANGMDKVMKEAGYKYNATNLRKLADDVLFNDKVGYIDRETGEYEEITVPTFLSEYRDYQAALVKMSYDVNKAKQKFDSTKDPKDEEAWANAKAAQEHHQHLYFQSKYSDEFYKLDEALMNDYIQEIEIDGKVKTVNVGALGKARIGLIIDKIQELDSSQKHKDEMEALQDADTRAALWREYRAHFAERDELGIPKEGLDLEIAKALKAHRAVKNKFYEWKPIAGAFESALTAAEAIIEGVLESKDITDKESIEYKQEYQKMKDQWLASNTRIKIKDEFYEIRGNIHAQIKEILDDLEEKRLASTFEEGSDYEGLVRFDEIYENINDIMSSKRDNDGQPVATDMTEEAIEFVKSEQEKMKEAKKDFVKLSGLTELEYEELQDYFNIVRTKDPMTGQRGKLDKEDSARFQELLDRKDKLGIDPLIKQTLISLWTTLENLQSKVPTEYYVELADQWYQEAIRPNMDDDAPSNLTHEIAGDLLDPHFIQEYLDMEGNEEFAAWYKANHIKIEKYVPSPSGKGGIKVPYYERVQVWNVIRPNDSKYYETTTIKRDDGSEELIDGVPTLQYSYRSVKPSYTNDNGEEVPIMTGYNPKSKKVEIEIGVHQDNRGDNGWLPRPLADMQKKYAEDPNQFSAEMPYDKYINKEYRALKQEANSPIYKVLEKLKEFALKHQEGLDSSQKLYLQLPRYRRSKYDYVIGAKGEDIFSRMQSSLRGIRDDWRTRKDDFEEHGLNYEDDWAYTHGSMMFAPSGKPIPLGGRFKMDDHQISRDIMTSMMKHMYSIEMHNKLKETQHIADGFKTLMNEMNPDDVRHIQKKRYPHLPIISGEGDKKRRTEAVNALHTTWWEGQQMAQGFGKKGIKGVKTVNNLLGMASHAFFAFDITSALKNYYGAQFQIGMEAAAGQTYWNPITKKKEKMMNYADYALGRVWAAQANARISTEIYKTTSKHIDLQIQEVFDPMQGRMEDTFGESIGRSFAKDVASGTWTTTHRKYVENLGTLQLFSGIMHSIRVPQMVGDKKVMIRYIDAWQVNSDSGTIELKEGIDKTYGLGGDMFKLYRNRMHEISNLNQGMYSKMDSPQANRYLVFRMVISMRKFFMKMFLQRWSRSSTEGFKIYNPTTWDRLDEKWNPALGDFHMGYYARTAKTIGRIVNNPSYLMHMDQNEKAALLRTALEPVKAWAFTKLMFLMFSLWDWDPEDPDKWKKLKERSGAMPSVFTNDKYTEGFNLWGWTQNQALLLSLNVNQENTFFMPTFKGLAGQLDITSETSITTAATVGSYLDFLQLYYRAQMDDKKAFYSKDVGAMNYQQAGQPKYLKILNKMIGNKGKFKDPVTSTKNILPFL